MLELFIRGLKMENLKTCDFQSQSCGSTGNGVVEQQHHCLASLSECSCAFHVHSIASSAIFWETPTLLSAIHPHRLMSHGANTLCDFASSQSNTPRSNTAFQQDLHPPCSVTVVCLCPPTAAQRKTWPGRRDQALVRACGRIPGPPTVKCTTTREQGPVHQDAKQLPAMTG